MTPLPPLGSIPILIEKDGMYVASGEFFHPSHVSQSRNVNNAELETLKHQHYSSLENIKELEGKNRDLTARRNVLEISVGTGILH